MHPDNHEETRPVEWGDHFLILEPHRDGTLAVFGKVMDSIDAFCDQEAACGLSPTEVETQRQLFTDLYHDGWRPADLYSETHPEGQWLCVPETTITQKISAEAFETARRCGWNLDYLLRERLIEVESLDAPEIEATNAPRELNTGREL